jgi:hypothetical protein
VTRFEGGNLRQCSSTRVSALFGARSTHLGLGALEGERIGLLIGNQRSLSVPSRFLCQRVRPAVLGNDLL